MGGREQLGRHLPCLDSGAPEREREKKKLVNSSYGQSLIKTAYYFSIFTVV